MRWRGACCALVAVLALNLIVGTPHTVNAATPTSVLVLRVGGLEIADSSGGPLTCNGGSCFLTTEVGALASLTATPQPGWTFVGWDSALCSGSGACEFTVPAPDPFGLGSNVIRAIAAPDSTAADVTLSELQLPAQVQGSKLKVYDLSTDGRFLLYAVDGTQVRWHDLVTAEDVHVGDDQYNAVAMSADGGTVVWTDNNRVMLWDSLNRLPTQLSAEGTRPSLSADGRFVAWWWSSVVTVLDRNSGTTTSFASSWLPVVAPDGSSVAIPTFSGFELYDPLTGQLQRSYATSYMFGVLRISANSAYAYGLINNAPASELGFARVDLASGEVLKVPHSWDPYGCSGYRFGNTALDDGSAYFTTWGNGDDTGLGPTSTATFDFYGMYRADFSLGVATASSITGAELPFATPSNDCPSVVATPDGSKVVFATERLLPTTPQPPAPPPSLPATQALGSFVRAAAVPTGGSRIVVAATGTNGGCNCTPPAAPAAPTGSGSGTQVTVNWVAPSVTNGAPVDQFEVQYSTNASTGFAAAGAGTCSATLTGSAVSCTITGLTPGTSYFTRVRARNAGGWSAWSASSAAITVPAPPPTVRPTAPGRPVVTVLDGALSITWTAPTTGAPISDYVVQRATRSLGPYTAVTAGTCATHPLTATTCTVTGLTNGTGYYFRVVASNAAGTGPVSLRSVKTKAAASPSAVVGPTCTRVITRTLLGAAWVAWGSAASNGSIVTRYEYSFKRSNVATWGGWTSNLTRRTLWLTGLTKGAGYDVRVRAVNALGTGPTSSCSVTP